MCFLSNYKVKQEIRLIPRICLHRNEEYIREAAKKRVFIFSGPATKAPPPLSGRPLKKNFFTASQRGGSAAAGVIASIYINTLALVMIIFTPF